MKLLGLEPFLKSIFQSRPTPLQWGMTAKKHLPKPKPTTAARKSRRKMVRASKRRNRRS